MSSPPASGPPASSIGPKASPGSRRRWILLLVAGLVLVIAIALVVAVVSFGLSRRLTTNPGSGPTALVGASVCGDPSECAISIRFAGPVDHKLVVDSLRIDPPTTLVVTWNGDVLQIRPAPLLTS